MGYIVWVESLSGCHKDDIDFLVPLREQQESVFVIMYELLSRVAVLKPLCGFIVVCWWISSAFVFRGYVAFGRPVPWRYASWYNVKCCVKPKEITYILRCLNNLLLLLAWAVLQLHLCVNLRGSLVQLYHFIVNCSEYLLQSFGMTKRNELSMGQKIKVLESLQTRNQIQVASEFEISQSAFSRIESRETDVQRKEMPDRKRNCRPHYRDTLDRALVRY